MNLKDFGPYLATEVICANTSVTANSTNDNTEITPTDDIDMEKYISGKVVIQYKCSINTSETMSFGLQAECSETDGGSKDTDVVILASTVVETGSLSAHEGTYEINISADDIAAWHRYVNFLPTCDLSRSGTDTAEFSAIWVGLLKKS